MITEFMNYLRNIKGYSENTVNSYGKDLRDFARWMKGTSSTARWSTITRDDIDKYLTSQAQRGLKPATTNRRLSAISGLYGYMRRNGIDIDNPCSYECRRKIAKTVPNTIPAEDIKLAYDHSHGVAKVALGLLATTGIRIQELLDIEWHDIDFQSQAIRVHGKGGKDRVVFTTADKLETLKAVYDMSEPTGYIFSLDQRAMRYLIFDALRPYSMAKQLSPHAIRHTMATHAATHGVNVTTLAQTLGHSQLQTTQKYIDMTAAPVKTVCQQYNIFN